MALKSLRSAGEAASTELSGVDAIGWEAWDSVLLRLNETLYILSISSGDSIEVRKVLRDVSGATAR
jgi:hypothetical protein